MLPRNYSFPALAGLLLLTGSMFALAPLLHAEEGKLKSAAPLVHKDQKAASTSSITSSTTPSPATNTMASASPGSNALSGDIYTPWIGKKFQRGPANDKKIALTFDDGPNPKTTPRVVEILKQAGVTATFFWLGDMVAKNPSTALLVKNNGFEFGSHTYTHKNLKAISADAVRQEMISAQDTIQQVTGNRPHLFRPPYGNINSNVIKTAQDDKLVIVLWAVDSDDWRPRMTPDKVFERVTQQTHPGAVILLHDIHEKSIQILPRLIADLKSKGYQFVTVSQLIEEANKHPEALTGAGAEEVQPPSQPLAIPLEQTK